MQNSLSKFHNFLFQFSKFAFYHFSPLSFNSSQFNPPLTFRLLLPLTCSKQCRFGLNLIFNFYLFLNLKKPRNQRERRDKSKDQKRMLLPQTPVIQINMYLSTPSIKTNKRTQTDQTKSPNFNPQKNKIKFKIVSRG